jgi:hypothetical protein
MKPKADREAQRRLVLWDHIRNYALIGRDPASANVDEVELVRWVEDALRDIRKSLARHTTRI